MTPRDRADRAQQILNDEVFKHAFRDIRETIVGKLESCGVGDIDAQHELTVSLQLLKQLKTQLARYAEEIMIDEAKAKQDSWMAKARQRFTP
jgi:hypothetical protein